MNSTWSTATAKRSYRPVQQKRCVHCGSTGHLFFGGMDGNGQIVYICKEASDKKLDLSAYGVVDDDLFLPTAWRQ